MEHPILVHNCPQCDSDLKPATNLIGTESPWFAECVNPKCNTVVNWKFAPTDYQLCFFALTEYSIGYFGGYGAGKTTSAAIRVLLYILQVLNGQTLVGSNSWQQMMMTNVKELVEIIPKCLVKPGHLAISLSTSKPFFECVFKNGHQLVAKVLLKEGSIRSYNLTGFWIEEASEVQYSIYNQLMTRQRNTAGVEFERDAEGNIVMEQFKDNRGYIRKRPKQIGTSYLGVLSSNPDPGWIRTKFLHNVPDENLHYFGTDKEIEKSLHIRSDEKNPFMAAVVVPTEANYFLPDDFIAKNSIGKSQAWINKYLKGSFSFSDGLVYADYEKHEVEPFEIPSHWKQLLSADFGRRAPMAYLRLAIDPDDDVVYVVEEYYQAGGDWGDWVKGFWDMYEKVSPTSWLMPPVGDPAGEVSGQANPQTWFQGFAEYNIHFMPSRTGKGSELGVAAGVALTSEYFRAGKLKYFSNLKNFKMEIAGYKYKTTAGMDEEEDLSTENPVKWKDHLMDCLKGAISVLPRNPNVRLDKYDTGYVHPSQTLQINQYHLDDYNDPRSAAFWSADTKESGDHLYDLSDGDVINDFRNIEDEYNPYL